PPGLEPEALHPARRHDRVRVEDLEVESHGQTAAMLPGPAGIRDEMIPAHDDRDLGLDALDRRVAEKADGGIGAAQAVHVPPSPAASEHRLDDLDLRWPVRRSRTDATIGEMPPADAAGTWPGSAWAKAPRTVSNTRSTVP